MKRQLRISATIVIAIITYGFALLARADNSSYVDTVQGSLTVQKKGEGSSAVLLNNSSIFETNEYNSSIDRVLSGYPKADRILVMLSSGGTACPALFRIVDLSKQSWFQRMKSILSKPKLVSAQFGTCDDAPEVRNAEGKITFDFASKEGMRRWTYTFSDRKLTEEALSAEAYKAIKLAAIASAVGPALHEHRTAIEQINDNLPSTVHESYLDKTVYVENASGSISNWMKLGDAIALILSNKGVERVGAVSATVDESIIGIGIEYKKGAGRKSEAFFFEDRGGRLYYRLYGSRETLAAVRSPADNAFVANAMWNAMGADRL